DRKRQAGAGARRRVRPGHPAALRRGRGRGTRERTPARRARTGTQRDRPRLHPDPGRAFRRDPRCGRARRRLSRRSRPDSRIPRLQRSRAMIEVRGLHKAFGPVKAVDGVSFVARDGEISGLRGPNGAGKTTTLRMLYTLMKPDRGEVLVDGFDASVDPVAVRRRLGVLPDARGLYKRLTARENIDYFGRLQGMDEARLASQREHL